MVKVIAEIDIRLDDRRVRAGETIEVDKKLADELVRSKRLKAVVSSKKKTTDEER